MSSHKIMNLFFSVSMEILKLVHGTGREEEVGREKRKEGGRERRRGGRREGRREGGEEGGKEGGKEW